MKPLRDNPIEEGIDAFFEENKGSKKKSKNSKMKFEIMNRNI